jgi:hypothetical protein
MSRRHAALFLLIASSVCLTVFPAAARGTSLSVLDFGAVPDGATQDTAAIQKAIDTCSGQGGGTISFPPGRYVTGTLLLKTGVTLHLDVQAVLLGSLRISDYQMIEGFRDGKGSPMGYCLIGAVDAENIHIEGGGTIDGRGKDLLAARAPEDHGKRPFLIRLVRCKDVFVKDVHLQGPAAWTFHLAQCSGVQVTGIHIASVGLSNNDGIDIDSSQRVFIRDCDIDSGDDAICLKTTTPLPCRDIHVQGCTLKTHWGGIKLGTESVGDFDRISVSNCHIIDAHGGIKIMSVDGAKLADVTISEIDMTNVTMPIFIRLGARLKTFRIGDSPRPIGSLENVDIRNLRADCSSPLPILISGIPGHDVTNVHLDQINLRFPGGGSVQDADAVIEEKESAYPEITIFGKQLPACAVLARHINHLVIGDLAFTLQAPDARPALICQHVQNLNCANWNLPAEACASHLLQLDSTTNAVIELTKVLGKPAAFLKVTGADSGGIELEDILLGSIPPFQLGDGAPPDAVQVH